MKRSIALALVLVQLAPAAASTPFPRIPPYLPVPKGAAVIMKTGSTNTSGYRIVAQPEGSTEYIAATGRAAVTISRAVAQKLFEDLRAAQPLSNLPHEPCMKSVSFGTSLFVWWEHQRSPDLACPTDARGRALLDDATQIAQNLHISATQPMLRPLMPGEQHKPLPPAPSPSPT